MTRTESWDRAFRMIQAAFSEEEIAAAEAAMRQHLTDWPDDLRRDPWHGWASTIEAAKQRRAQADQLGLAEEGHWLRELLLQHSEVTGDYVEDSSVVVRMQAATDLLRRWMRLHPDDEFTAERLSTLLRDIELAQQSRALYAELAFASSESSDPSALVGAH